MSIGFSRRTLVRASAGLAALSAEGIGAQGLNQATPLADSIGQAVVTMSPQHGSRFALPATTIAIRGVTLDQIANIYVKGSRSGPAHGVLREHSDGNGVTWEPDARFFETETVTVTADVPLTNTVDGAATFVVAEQAPRLPTTPITDRTSVSAGDDLVHSFRSRPDMAPVKIDVGLIDESRIAPGVVAVSPNVPGGQSGPHIVDNAGETIWHHTPADPNQVVYCFKRQTYNGVPVLTWAESPNIRGLGYGHHVFYDQSYEQIATVQAGHGLDGLDVHDLVITDYGTAWVFSYNAVWADVNGARQNVMEGVIQEIEIATGEVWWEWHSLDHIGTDESESDISETPDLAWDYLHINSLDVDHDGALLISSRTCNSIYKIDVNNHEVVWRLGGIKSDFPLADDAKFFWQHDAQRLPDGTISIFDNHDDTNRTDSRGIVLELDEEAMTATLVREYHRDGGMWSPYQANMQTLENGNVFIGWGSGPRCSEFTADGEMIFDMKYRAGGSYRGYRIDWEGTPSRPIDYLLEDAADGSLTAYVSWNGATDIASWRVIDGNGAEVARAPKTTFETQVTGIPISSYLEAQAINAAGQIIGGRILQRGG